MEEERDDLTAMMNMMENTPEHNMKISFFDDGQSMESKKERDKEEDLPPGTNNEEIKSRAKLHDVTVNNEDEAVMFVNLKKKKRMNPHDEYYSVKLPKFIGVCPDIKKLDQRARGEGVYSGETEGAQRMEDVTHLTEARNVIDLEGEGRHPPHKAKNQQAIICWKFDVDAYDREKEKKDSQRREEELEGHSNESDLAHVTDDDLSDYSTVDELYQMYDVTHNGDDLMSLPCDDPNEKTNILCTNMKFLETNSFIVEYEDGKFIFFINEKPYLVESDKETNYLIEMSDMSIMPIHCILEKKIFLKSITREEQGVPQGTASPGRGDTYYSLHG
ncbi:hypothetical protein AK88_04025 [Plasmodium fragile]|uniref:Uncharacterized protein n=1 Tax=Plasmodium fragile TaxID=5857 RepID=A0A0D9QKQ4_PLAFR|nr:uncharacterized protein AK88_04025 [Plasmodium fragile]KJP86306.1 hypothetical protein AK88_04025 [Plasmodium fragile]